MKYFKLYQAKSKIELINKNLKIKINKINHNDLNNYWNKQYYELKRYSV